MSHITGKKRAYPSSEESSDPTRESTTRDRKKAKHEPEIPEYDSAGDESNEKGSYYRLEPTLAHARSQPVTTVITPLPGLPKSHIPWIPSAIERTRPPANRADDDKKYLQHFVQESQPSIQRGRKRFASKVQRPSIQEESQPLDLDAIVGAILPR
ncbi:hypothetical protein M408DRAFT_12103 [Serendipita vermifera MAFF 305830]|uniref:Uncharacterized protein n=1 Tax=Serendipita vermifera MAFF 305830 TaxID=933852 RepID=A0A0C2WY77_SERVB|nr:hypothetical protein M408DRAFT_12103 [Serendipita vermifera MAFF 305830]